jgi:Domain of unknown function (DUF4288)
MRRLMIESWFSAKLRVLCLIEGHDEVTQDEVVHIFRATDFEAAFHRALDLGRSHETDYPNGDGKIVRWRFERVVTLDQISAADLDGAEVYSEMSDVESPRVL